MSKKHKKICTILSYNELTYIVTFAVIGCASISAFVSLVGIPIGIAS